MYIYTHTQYTQTQQKHSVNESPHEGPFKPPELKESDFELKHKEFNVMIVNFYAPWCHWCVANVLLMCW